MAQFEQDQLLNALKGMAWERVKGELRSIAAASYPPSDGDTKERFDWEDKTSRRQSVIDAFLKTMNDEELFLV